MELPDWSRFTRLIYINAKISELYNCWASQHGLESWFLKTAEYYRHSKKLSHNELCKTGDTYLWKWHNWDGKSEGKVIEANGKNKLVVEFANSIVTVNLYSGRGKVCVELQQTNIPTDITSQYQIHHGCSCGWTFWLANLKAWKEHGIVLNDMEDG